MNQDLPTFVVLNATHSHPKANVQAISARFWSAGFLLGPVCGRGVAIRRAIPCCTSTTPTACPPRFAARMLDGLKRTESDSTRQSRRSGNQHRIAQYEMAFRMQSSVPELTDISKEPDSTYKLYGEDARKGGTFANSCLMARRLVERGVRFVQIYHRGWDVHGNLPEVLPEPVQGCRSGLLGAGAGSEAARDAG